MPERRPDEAEILNNEQRDALTRELRAIGPGWIYSVGTGGLHRAERVGTHRHEQGSLTARGLVAAVRERELAINPDPVPVATGAVSTQDRR
jgi:hypothetical protein